MTVDQARAMPAPDRTKSTVVVVVNTRYYLGYKEHTYLLSGVAVRVMTRNHTVKKEQSNLETPNAY